jgi:hypothetical protein
MIFSKKDRKVRRLLQTNCYQGPDVRTPRSEVRRPLSHHTLHFFSLTIAEPALH